LRAAKHGQRREREDGSTNRERRAARERDDAVEAEDDFRRRKPVESEQRGHRREGCAHKHRATILVPDAYRRQGNRRPGGGHRPHTDTQEMDDAGNHDILGAKELSSRQRQYCHSASEHQDRNDSISHETDIDRRSPVLENVSESSSALTSSNGDDVPSSDEPDSPGAKVKVREPRSYSRLSPPAPGSVHTDTALQGDRQRCRDRRSACKKA
jgi:hypothetical protein